VFRDFRRLIEAIRSLAFQVEELASAQRNLGPAVERLEALELSRHQFEAEVAGTLLKAEGKLKAASNAEARERQLKKSYENRTDPLNPDGEEEGDSREAFLADDAERSEEERLQALRLDVAPNRKANALRHKWAGTR